MILGIDPGTEQSGVVLFEDARVSATHVLPNHDLVLELRGNSLPYNIVAIEMMDSYGMPVGKEVFETLVWIGRFIEAAHGLTVVRKTRREIKLHLCNNARAKDANIRQVLLDRVGKPGTKKNRGPTYGVTGHCWSALAVAVVVADTHILTAPGVGQGDGELPRAGDKTVQR